MKKKNVISLTDGQNSFTIFSLSANVEDFRLAFLLNRKLGLQLHREDNLMVFPDSKSDPTPFSFFHFNRDKQTCFYLIHNLNEQQPLINNYFLLINGFFTPGDENDLLSAIGEIHEVLSVNPFKLSESHSSKKGQKKTLELINAILTDLEYHTLEVNRKKNEGQVQLKIKEPTSIKKLY
ncbi:MAG: IPExxxVDY family protein [Bacteroidales bacterium]|nr:IPExxxVDY family protein [Bacteroidales bacterium]